MNAVFIIFLLGVILLFITGFYCLIITRNLIRILIALEVLTKGVTLLLVIVGKSSGQISLVQTFIITLIIIEVVVIAVAAGIVLGIFSHNNSLDIRKIRNLKG